MNKLARLCVPAALAAAAICFSERDAHALGPIDLELGLKAGVATNPNSDGLNPFGFGIGGRAGVGFYHFYGGLSAIHYFGASKDNGNGTSVSESSTLIGIEVGYSITQIPVIVLRPQIGVGNATFSPSAGDSASHLYLEPGLLAMIPLGLVYIGADVNLLVIPGVDTGVDTPSTTFTSFAIHGQIGLKF